MKKTYRELVAIQPVLHYNNNIKFNRESKRSQLQNTFPSLRAMMTNQIAVFFTRETVPLVNTLEIPEILKKEIRDVIIDYKI